MTFGTARDLSSHTVDQINYTDARVFAALLKSSVSAIERQHEGSIEIRRCCSLHSAITRSAARTCLER
jgi:hypothetical protein